MILVFLDEESEILLVMLWIRTRPASRIFPVKVKPVKIKPGKPNIKNVTIAKILVLIYEKLTCPTYGHNCPQRSSSWQGPRPSKQGDHSFCSSFWNMLIMSLMGLKNKYMFWSEVSFLWCHSQSKFSIELTSDHIPEPEFQPPIESRVFNRGFFCFKLLNLNKT